MKIFDFEIVREICSGLNPSVYCDWIEDALRKKDDFCMPVKSRISQDDGNYYAIMPCLCAKDNLAMVKMIGRHNQRPGGVMRSTMMSDMLVYEADTGILEALMDAEYITTLRTGAAAAQSAMMYGKDDFSVIGLIGLGNIMTVCVSVLLSKLSSRSLVLKLYKHHNQEERLSERFKDYKNVKFVYCDTYEETIKGSNIVISAVTRVTENFCTDDCYDEGCTVIPVMTMGFLNCDLFFDKVFTDEIDQIRDFRYFNDFRSVQNSTEVMKGLAPGRENDRERILVYNYGLAIHDLYFASRILELAGKNGRKIEYNYCKEKFFM